MLQSFQHNVFLFIQYKAQ